jgi:hypothetical protein
LRESASGTIHKFEIPLITWVLRSIGGSMSVSFVLYENPAMGERLLVKSPLQSLVNVEELAREMQIPEYVDLRDFQARKIIVTLYAATHPNGHYRQDRLKTALFGGGAFRLHCPSSNKGPFSRKIGDYDLVVLKEDGQTLVDILLNLPERYGTLFYHGLSLGDKRFNTMRARMRYRVHTIQDIDESGVPVGGLMDIFCDKLTFCHTINVRDELQRADKNLFTIGLEKMIISKAQLIRRVPKQEAWIDENRIMGEYDKKEVIVGMEAKDMKDVAAAFFDHDLGDGKEKINIDLMGRKLKQDWRIWKTVSMNLANMHKKARKIIVGDFGATQDELAIVEERLGMVVEQLEGRYKAKEKFSFNKQWWEDVQDQVL